MNDRHSDMLEATRLTRAGQLTEATALLQRMLRGKTACVWEAANTPPRRVPYIIDVVATTIEVANPRLFSRTEQPFGCASLRAAGRAEGTALPHMPGALRSFLDPVKPIGSAGHPRSGASVSGVRAQCRAGRRTVRDEVV